MLVYLHNEFFDTTTKEEFTTSERLAIYAELDANAHQVTYLESLSDNDLSQYVASPHEVVTA